MKKRLKNKALWVSIIAFLGMLLGNYGLYEGLGLTAESFQNIANALLSIFVIAGIIQDPTTNNCGFKDDKK